ncbi:hypothetical protein [Kytococcus schroeteri]|uniref:hypothetical protein n=1 Tax=Kytococcus schroeteri TaxID=138300 RepID=UPI001EE2015F|nr:hypothetical protein [Kytococcus schroeteri]
MTGGAPGTTPGTTTGGGQPVLTLAADDLADLASFTARAKHLDAAGAMRLQLRDGVLASWVCVVPGAGLLQEGTVLGMRAVPAACPVDVDVVVPLAAVTDRLAARSASTTTLPVPPSEVAAPWAAASPPMTGWEPVVRVDTADLAELTRTGVQEVSAGAPAGSGAAAVADLRRRVWSRSVGAGWPQGLALGADALGFLTGADEAVVLRSGPWWRLATPTGHVLAR